jgi:hypothetical protein
MGIEQGMRNGAFNRAIPASRSPRPRWQARPTTPTQA